MAYPQLNFLYYAQDTSSGTNGFFIPQATCHCQNAAAKAEESKPRIKAPEASRIPDPPESPESTRVSLTTSRVNSKTELPNQSMSLQFASHKIKHLRCLFNLLVKIFLNSRIDMEDVNLSLVESSILVQILRRKFPNVSAFISLEKLAGPEELLILVERAKTERSNKRIEENIKFVYKHSMKRLKEQFLADNLDPNPGSEPEAFYRYYFKEISETNRLPYENFHDPLNNRRRGSQKGAKTLNSEYLNLLFSSARFLKDLKDYLVSTQLILDYQKSIRKKLEKMLAKWERMLAENSDSKVLRAQVNDYFLKNKQCKLPWTSNEIISAINYFLTNVKEFEM